MNRQENKYTGEQGGKYARWLEGKTPAVDAVTGALDHLYAKPNTKAKKMALAALQNRLAKEIAPIYYDRIDTTPLGPVWVAAGSRGLVAIEYNGSEETFRGYLARITKGSPQRSAERVAEIKAQVLSYLTGRTSHIQVDVDLSGIPQFQRRVLEETRKVPRGQVSTYAEIARRIGNPKAVRAVGQALRRNPVPIVVPCHRVIASDGSLGGYSGEMRSQRKLQLLQLEGAMLA